METTSEREQKHHHRERRTMMHSANEHTTHFFLLCAQAYVNTHFFLIYFFSMPIAYTARPKTKERATSLSLSLFYSYIYICATKVITSFFLGENDKPDRKSLQQRSAWRQKKATRFD